LTKGKHEQGETRTDTAVLVAILNDGSDNLGDEAIVIEKWVYNVESIEICINESLHSVKREACEFRSGCVGARVGRRCDKTVGLGGTWQCSLMLLQFEMDQPRSPILKDVLQILGYGEIRVCDVKINGRPQDDLVGCGEVVIRSL